METIHLFMPLLAELADLEMDCAINRSRLAALWLHGQHFNNAPFSLRPS
jgi:hypothetical protein